MPKDRGAEQGDVDGPLGCSLALGMVAAEARLSMTEQQFRDASRRRERAPPNTSSSLAEIFSPRLRTLTSWSPEDHAGAGDPCDPGVRRSRRFLVPG